MHPDLIAHMTKMRVGERVNLIVQCFEDDLFEWGPFELKRRVRECRWCNNSALCEVFTNRGRTYIFHIRGKDIVPHVDNVRTGKSSYASIEEQDDLDDDAMEKRAEEGKALNRRRIELRQAIRRAEKHVDDLKEEEESMEDEIDAWLNQ